MPHNSNNQLGTTLRTRREELGISIRKLAGLVGITHSSVIRIEGGSTPKPDVLNMLAANLELPLEKLYTLAGYPVPNDLSDMPAYLRGQYHDLPESARKEVDNFILSLTHKYGLQSKGPQDGEDETT